MSANDTLDDGMQHDYRTCPLCGCIRSAANIVRVDSRSMCRECLTERMASKPAERKRRPD